MARNVFGKLSEIPRWKNVNKLFPSAHRNHPSMENLDISTVTVSKCLASSVYFLFFFFRSNIQKGLQLCRLAQFVLATWFSSSRLQKYIKKKNARMLSMFDSLPAVPPILSSFLIQTPLSYNNVQLLSVLFIPQFLSTRTAESRQTSRP